MEAELTSFIATTPQQQCQELRTYFKTLGADISTQPSLSRMEDDLHTIIGVSDICFQGRASHTDIESVLNGIVSIVMIAEQEALDGLVIALCEKLAKAWEPEQGRGLVALKVLRILFFSLTADSHLRYHVYYYMVEVSNKTSLAVGCVNLIYNFPHLKLIGGWENWPNEFRIYKYCTIEKELLWTSTFTGTSTKVI